MGKRSYSGQRCIACDHPIPEEFILIDDEFCPKCAGVSNQTYSSLLPDDNYVDYSPDDIDGLDTGEDE